MPKPQQSLSRVSRPKRKQGWTSSTTMDVLQMYADDNEDKETKKNKEDGKEPEKNNEDDKESEEINLSKDKKEEAMDTDALHLKPLDKPLALSVVESAPSVQPNERMDPRRHVRPVKEDNNTELVYYNPKFEDLYAPQVGPVNPFKKEYVNKNTFTGHVEPAHLDQFQFELQRRTFHSYGHAQDPSTNASSKSLLMASTALQSSSKSDNDAESEPASSEAASSAAESSSSVFESTGSNVSNKRRKKERNDDPSDIEGYLGPWAKYKDEELCSVPNEEDKAFLDDYVAKMKRRGKKANKEMNEEFKETTSLHIKDIHDYQGRSFLHPPQDTSVNLKQAPEKCFLPKRLIHTWQGHNKGIAAMQWFPKTAHLLLSGGLDNKVKLWEAFNDRRCVRTYSGHRMAVKAIDFDAVGARFLTSGYDRQIKLWDTETGQCSAKFSNGKTGHCVKFNPDDDKQSLFLVGCNDKRIVCWDIRANEIVQEYDRHLAAVNTITFVDENRRFVTTSDDKSLRVWEWNIPVDMKYIADPQMHSMPAVTISPNQKWLACQSLDNKIAIYTCGDRFREHRKKSFKGHMVAGYACTVDFSPDMSYLVSGDGDGKCCIWDWKTTRMLTKWKAHDRVCISVLWHPHETSKVATAGWDGLIKYWD